MLTTRSDKNNISKKCLYIYIAILPLSYINIGSFGSFYKLVSIGLCALCIFDFLSSSQFKLYISKAKAWWIIYILYITLSILWTRGYSLHRAKGLILIGIMSLVLTWCDLSQEDFKNVKDAWFIATLIFIVLFFTSSAELANSGGRYVLYITGTAVDPNEYSTAFSVGVYLTIEQIMLKKGKLPRIIYILLLATIIYIVLRSGSRSGLLAISVTALITIFMIIRINPRKVVGVFIILLILYIILNRYIISLIPDSVLDRLTIQSIIQSGGSNRTVIWKSYLSSYIDENILRKLFGVGLGGRTTTASHNFFLQNLSDLGIVGLIIYICFLLSAYVNVINCKFKKLFIGPLLSYLVSSMVLTPWSTNKAFWTFFLIPLLNISNIANKKKDGAES